VRFAEVGCLSARGQEPRPAAFLRATMAATSKPPRLRESPRLLRGHHHTSLEASTPRCNTSLGTLRCSGIVRLPAAAGRSRLSRLAASLSTGLARTALPTPARFRPLGPLMFGSPTTAS
jgi:hypothetical protein